MTNMQLSSAKAENMEEAVTVAPMAITMPRSHSFVFLRASSNTSSRVALCCLVSGDYISRY